MIGCPRFDCFLSDENGNALCPYDPGAINYTDLCPPNPYPNKQVVLLSGKVVTDTVTSVLINGNITISANGDKIIKTVPFSTINCIQLPFQTCDRVKFLTKYFYCKAVPFQTPHGVIADEVKVNIYIETVAFAENAEKCEKDAGLRCVTFQSCISMYCNIDTLGAEIYQYNARSDGRKRIYTNEDELTQYGNKGLLSKDTVSLNNLFVNGVIQPKTNYDLGEGYLKFETEDLPEEGAPISVLFLTLKNHKNYKMIVENNFYVAVSDGLKKKYTNSDALTEYGDKGIPSPRDVSYFNLYVNGVLQPQPTYVVSEGLLQITEAPKKGETIILEAMVIK